MKLKRRWGWESNFVAEHIESISYVVLMIVIFLLPVILAILSK